MSITVYSVSGAPRAWRVLLGLTFKGLPHDINVLQASKKEHKSAEYLKIHPRGTVPALEYNGLILQDSIAILAWLDRQFPESPLFGETAGDAARIWQATLESCDYLRAATNDVLFSLLVLGKPVPEQWNEERQTLLDNAQRDTTRGQLVYRRRYTKRRGRGLLPRTMPNSKSYRHKTFRYGSTWPVLYPHRLSETRTMEGTRKQAT